MFETNYCFYVHVWDLIQDGTGGGLEGICWNRYSKSRRVLGRWGEGIKPIEIWINLEDLHSCTTENIQRNKTNFKQNFVSFQYVLLLCPLNGCQAVSSTQHSIKAPLQCECSPLGGARI